MSDAQATGSPTDRDVEQRERTGSWLIVGHGTVGSVLSERILAAKGTVAIRDDDPRIDVGGAVDARVVSRDEHLDVDFVALCVPHHAAEAAAAYLRQALIGKPIVFDWTSTAPSAKISVADPAVGDWIDVALLDSLDRPLARPLLAISGSRHDDARVALQALGFDVAIAGESVGDAAAVKLTRSLFMKSIEALVVEYRSVASLIDPAGAAWLSIERSLGRTFTDFSDVLVTSNAVHAARRASELDNTVAFAGDHGFRPPLAIRSAEVLHSLASLWSEHPPRNGANVDELLAQAREVFER